MKRPVILVLVKDSATGIELHRTIKAAFNAGIRAAEDAVRSIARATGESYVRGAHLASVKDDDGMVQSSYAWTGTKTGRTIHTIVERLSRSE